jgi:methyl-accepting chemotaxis protein
MPMSIKAKLLLLISVIISSFVIIVVGYFLALAPIDKIRDETAVLMDLRDRIIDEEILINRLLGQLPYVRGLEDFYESVEETNKVFEQVEKIEYIRSKSEDIEDALGIIARLNQMKLERLEDFRAADNRFRESVTEIYIFIDSFNFVKIYQAKRFREDAGAQSAALFNLALADFLSQHSIYENVLDSSVSVITEQFKSIDKESRRIERNTLLGTGTVVVLALILVFIGSFIFANKIVVNIRYIEGSISRLKDGDLTSVANVNSKDDLARLNGNLTVFQDTMKGIINRIKGVSDENLSVRDQLISQVEETEVSSRSITISADEMSADIDQLNETARNSYESVEVISEKIRSLNESILEQTSMVEESSAAVNEMLASIANVEQVTAKKLGSLTEMVNSMESGNEQLKDTSMNIQKINNSIDAIRNMISVIEDISSQTNLLSMNAAIEAAHAGEYGKGFAVVSDEIRKLAEASSQNSREIGASLNEIIENIREATESSDTTLGTFSQTVKEVEGLFGSMSEISQSMVELKAGGDQILTAMDSLQAMAIDVRQDSTAMTDQSATVRTAVENVQAISGSVHSGVKQVSDGIKGISNAIAVIQGMTDTIGSVAERIGDELEFFKTAVDEDHLFDSDNGADSKKDDDILDSSEESLEGSDADEEDTTRDTATIVIDGSTDVDEPNGSNQ